MGVEWDNRTGVHINEYFRTANLDIYACGDCATPYKFTHAADFQARSAVRNMFLDDKNKLSDLLIPWCTYTGTYWYSSGVSTIFFYFFPFFFLLVFRKCVPSVP